MVISLMIMPIIGVVTAGIPHASGVELAASHRDSDHTGREGQEQSVAGSVQSQRQQLSGLGRVFSAPTCINENALDGAFKPHF